MGNYNTRTVKDSIIFRQSLTDFPCPVTLGRVTPSFGLHRFKQDLRFVPVDDEGFSLRGDKRRILYKGRKKSHRFTIMGDTSFEYDCILEKEPETNVISLRMEGAENFDFFRQPDFVREPFLKGSYAVYKKETLVGEGTGKLCHIHRPEIIDARGRRCWGKLAVVRDMLRITIPEKWLSEAAYPVIVDPNIGTTTYGSLSSGPEPDGMSYPFPFLDNQIAVNKYSVPNKGSGTCTAYVYAYERDYSCGYARPCLFTNNANNKPYLRKSRNENQINIDVYGRVYGWRNNTFNIDGFIQAGDYIWFGMYGECFTTFFDYGVDCYKLWVDEELYNVDYDDIPPYLNISPSDTFCNIKWSWYFSYTAVLSQDYVRKITQGVKLTDTRRLTGNYYRKSTQTASINSLLKRFEAFYRNCIMNAYNSINLNRLPVFYRNVSDYIKVSMDLFNSRFFPRKCIENIQITAEEKRKYNVFRKVNDDLNITDTNSFIILFLRRVPDSVNVTHTFEHWGDFIRNLKINVENIAETEHTANYKRFTSDSVNAVGTVFRALFMFVRIISKIVLRDYILSRFLIAKEDFILKSAICKEIILDSRID
jgi:hypothetical protein